MRGAILNSRIRRVVYGAADAKAGCCGSVTDLFALPFNHHPMVEQGLRAEEAGALLQAFFKRSAGAAGRSAEVETARTARREYEETVKKVEAAWKSEQLPLFFSANCAILFNGILSKPI